MVLPGLIVYFLHQTWLWMTWQSLKSTPQNSTPRLQRAIHGARESECNSKTFHTLFRAAGAEMPRKYLPRELGKKCQVRQRIQRLLPNSLLSFQRTCSSDRPCCSRPSLHLWPHQHSKQPAPFDLQVGLPRIPPSQDLMSRWLQVDRRRRVGSVLALVLSGSLHTPRDHPPILPSACSGQSPFPLPPFGIPLS